MTKSKVRDTAEDEKSKLPCGTTCDYAVDFGPHYPTSVGLVPGHVKHIEGKMACFNCKHRQHREEVLKEVLQAA